MRGCGRHQLVHWRKRVSGKGIYIFVRRVTRQKANVFGVSGLDYTVPKRILNISVLVWVFIKYCTDKKLI